MHTACSKCDRHARAATPEHGPACAELHKQRAGAALHAPTVNPGMMKSILLRPACARLELALAFREPFGSCTPVASIYERDWRRGKRGADLQARCMWARRVWRTAA